MHNGPKPLSCPYCEYKTADRSNYKKHVELHLNPRQFLCPLCKYAASKKCNLQYHIKSRHSGCSVALDVSKVKLRVKKPGPDSAEEKSESGANKSENSSSIEEDLDTDKGDEESSPINLSIRKSSRPSVGQPVQPEAPDKVQKKTTASERPPKAKDKAEPEKKVTRQKKVEKIPDSPVENASGTASVENKAKRRVKKLRAEKASVQDQSEAPMTPKEPTHTENSDQHGAEEARSARQRADREVMKKKDKKHARKSRKSGSKKSEKTAEHLKEAPQKPKAAEKGQKEKGVKEKALKRKAGEALDLSSKPCASSKTRRLKASAVELKPASQDSSKVTESHKSNRETPAKQKKTRSSKKKATIPQPAAGPASTISPSSEAPEVPHLDSLNTTHSGPAKTTTSTSAPAPPEPEKSLNKPPEDASPTCSSGEATPPPAEDRPAPTFLKPKSPPSLLLPGQRSKPADPEDDEGIHSSHEGGSDISDSASEGSDDSGLNGTGAGLTKMANDPETPTDEIPTPTELKSHMCIFCDRTFPLEVQYRRHLNRHLVNVYYMDSGAQK